MSRSPCSWAADSKTKWPKPSSRPCSGLTTVMSRIRVSGIVARCCDEHAVDPEDPHVGDDEPVALLAGERPSRRAPNSASAEQEREPAEVGAGTTAVASSSSNATSATRAPAAM